MTAPLDMNAAANEAYAALARGDARSAKALLDKILALQPNNTGLWLAKANAAGALGDDSEKSEAIERALAIDPSSLQALIAKADHLAEAGDLRGASAYYRAALRYMPRFGQLPVAAQQGLLRAKAATERVARELEDFVRAKLDAEGVSDDRASARFGRAVDVLLGKKKAYVQEPRYFFFPELPNIQFYERRDFPWMDRVEAATEIVRDELAAVIGGDFAPYVTKTLGRPQGDERGLINNPDWSAYFLRKNGEDRPGAARCSRTLQALSEAPLATIPGRAPSVLFSKLAAGAHIPPHTGMINARLICHLPLIVPDGCEFRVGNEVRTWSEGKVWAFDDTIEHEALNRSAADRYILIFDIWRPELSEAERAGVTALCAAIDSFRGAADWDA